ncbi:uncharacterized protein LOC123547707 isoform X2 [Mercenaria mercenaria]|uniref:uncharacterized protein LOC123547707 isoform X2 n=1 Tax=Mercenaria mercenaria TaxID=6596 RepID=UPI00234F61DE|nr:uncharacterized protein LOC123547707 isoform X2 [Mercenaria mercenaria]
MAAENGDFDNRVGEIRELNDEHSSDATRRNSAFSPVKEDTGSNLNALFSTEVDSDDQEIEALQQELHALEKDEVKLRKIKQKDELRQKVVSKRNEVKSLRDRYSTFEDLLTITDMDIFDFTFFLFLCDGMKHHFDCKWNCDSEQMKINLTETSNEMESKTIHDALQQLNDAFNTRSRESYQLTDSEISKAKEFIKDDKRVKQYPEVLIDAGVREAEQKIFVIMSTAENNDKFLTVKHMFDVKIGRKKVSKRPEMKRTELTVRPKASGISKKSRSFLTFEKINVTVVNDTLENIDGQVDGIVNPTNEKLDATGQVSKVLERLGGETYIQNFKKAVFPANRKSTIFVTGGGCMKTKTVLHVKCPQLQDKNEKEIQDALFNCVHSCLEMAGKKSLESVAIPLLFTGNAAIPVNRCGEQYAFAVMEFSRKRMNTFVVQDVIFVEVNERKTAELIKIFDDILPKSCNQLLEIPKHIDSEIDNADGNKDLSGLPPSFSTDVSFNKGEEHLIANTIDITVKKGDIRDCSVDAIVCPELQGEPYGGLLSVSIKCAYRHAFPSLRQMDKKVKKIVTNSCHRSGQSGKNVKYIFQVNTPLYKTEDDTNKLKESIHTVFKELKSKSEIKSVAFPLLGLKCKTKAL